MNSSAVCLMLLGRKKERNIKKKKVRNIKKKKSEEQVRASQTQKRNVTFFSA